MAKKISGSVGKGGKNKPEDTEIVQELLNAFTKQGGYSKLGVDKLVGKKTIAAIAAFQKNVVGMARPDSRIDPSGESFSKLSMGPKKVEAEAKKAEKAEKKQAATGAAKGGHAAGGGKPQVKGATSGVDKRLLGVLEAVSAHFGKPIVVETGKLDATASTDAKKLWEEWPTKLDRGMNDPTLNRNEKLRKELDALYCHTKFDKFAKLVDKKLKKGAGGGANPHTTGRAVDINRGTDAKVVAALATILRRENEGNVIHFDDGGKSLPSTISEAMKKKWR